MASDYRSIRKANEIRYGTDIGRIGRMLLADRYDDRTHFIYELLQNAEDALAKRGEENRHRSVRFHLSEGELRVSHFGKPFDKRDVRGICGIAESTKDITQIGRFGIGFKSVYAFTDRPEIHSGAEDFGIQNFVWPVPVPPVPRATDETIIVMPLRESSDCKEIQAGLQRLGPGALLFLHEIEVIDWKVDGGPSGFCIRQTEPVDKQVRRVTIIGQMEDQRPEFEQTWWVFSRPIYTPRDELAGQVEVAFFLNGEQIRAVAHSPLVVFFPTVVETNLGFSVQGPYRTTLSRDNVPRRDKWNQKCVKETARVLTDALVWLRDNDLLDIAVLRCLPIDPNKFDDESMFTPLYEETKRALSSQCLLPRLGGGYVAADNAKLGRSRELRELFDSDQLARLFGSGQKLTWLSGDISQNSTPELYKYLRNELGLVEVTSRTILSKLDTAFLERQNDGWVRTLYEFLNGRPALSWQASRLPLIRLEGGAHVPVQGGEHQSRPFLPGDAKTDFPTVRTTVCNSKDSQAFLRSIGLTEPDPVDDVIRNILPKYGESAPEISREVYDTDIRRILKAFKTDSKAQRDKLISALRQIPFVMAVDAGDGSKCRGRPGDLYLSTERLKSLFSGIAGVKLVDIDCATLRGESVRDLLEACGAGRYLRRMKDDSLSWEERRDLRRQRGQVECSSSSVEDWTLLGLDKLLAAFSGLSVKERRKKAELLWLELSYLEDRRGKAIFSGKHTWTWYGKEYSEKCDSAFVRRLNARAWIPDDEGALQRPELILFEPLGWTSNPFLQERIRFKLPVINQLAEEAGIEPQVLDLLKKLGITSAAELSDRLGLTENGKPEDYSGGPDTPEEALGALLGNIPSPTLPVENRDGDHSVSNASARRGTDTPTADGHPSDGPRGFGGSKHGGRSKGQEKTSREFSTGKGGARPFISYVAVHPDDEEPDPDGLKQSQRMALETKAIDFILHKEPNWNRTPVSNPGFDLFMPGPDGKPVRWCEVKAMTGSLSDRPVGMSRKQFDFACEQRADYWLYVVEHAGDGNARIVRIQDPAGKARTFTFDRGWLSIAQVHPEQENPAD